MVSESRLRDGSCGILVIAPIPQRGLCQVVRATRLHQSHGVGNGPSQPHGVQPPNAWQASELCGVPQDSDEDYGMSDPAELRPMCRECSLITHVSWATAPVLPCYSEPYQEVVALRLQSAFRCIHWSHTPRSARVVHPIAVPCRECKNWRHSRTRRQPECRRSMLNVVGRHGGW